MRALEPLAVRATKQQLKDDEGALPFFLFGRVCRILPCMLLGCTFSPSCTVFIYLALFIILSSMLSLSILL